MNLLLGLIFAVGALAALALLRDAWFYLARGPVRVGVLGLLSASAVILAIRSSGALAGFSPDDDLMNLLAAGWCLALVLTWLALTGQVRK